METWHVVYVVTFLEKLQQNIKPSFFCTTIDPDRPNLPSMMFGTGRKRLTETNECLVLESKIPFLWLDEIYSESIQLMSISPNGWKCPDEHGRGRNPMCPNMFKRLVILLHVLLRFRWGWCFFCWSCIQQQQGHKVCFPPVSPAEGKNLPFLGVDLGWSKVVNFKDQILYDFVTRREFNLEKRDMMEGMLKDWKREARFYHYMNAWTGHAQSSPVSTYMYLIIFDYIWLCFIHMDSVYVCDCWYF